MTQADAPGVMPPGMTLPGATPGVPPPLRLRAEDVEDLAVISACLQDALIAVPDLVYDPGARVFMLVANRFRWEDCRAGPGHGGGHGGPIEGGLPEGGPFARTLCGVTFDNVIAAAYRGFRRGEKDRILCLLAISLATDAANTAPGPAPGLTLDLDFAGDAKIRLTVSGLRCRARDFGDPWPTRWQPGHELPATN